MELTRISIAKFDATADPWPLQRALEAVPQVEAVEIDAGAHQALVAHEGADPDQRDLLNRSPREIAVMRGYVDVAAELAAAAATAARDVPSMARFLRE